MLFTWCASWVPVDWKYSRPGATVSKVTPKDLVFGLRLNIVIKVYLFNFRYWLFLKRTSLALKAGRINSTKKRNSQTLFILFQKILLRKSVSVILCVNMGSLPWICKTHHVFWVNKFHKMFIKNVFFFINIFMETYSNLWNNREYHKNV